MRRLSSFKLRTHQIFLALVLCLSSWVSVKAVALEEWSPPPTVSPSHTIYLDFSRHILALVGAEAPMIGCNWESRLGQSPVSLLSAFRLGYLKSDNTLWSYGLGLGARRYLYDPTEGAFLQFSMDVGESTQEGHARRRYGFAAVEYGYKAVYEDFVFAVHGGPQYYGFPNDKSTQLIIGIDFGFPLTAKSFRLP